MSLRWRERVTAVVMPEQVAVRLSGSVWRRSAPAAFSRPCMPGQAVAEAVGLALGEAVAQSTRRAWEPRPDVHLLLSHRLAPLTLVAHARHLQDDEERQAAARHGFAAVHGGKTAGWQIVVDGSAVGEAALAAGLDGPLMASLRQAVADAGLALHAVEPLFSEAARAATSTPAGWLVVAEPGRVVVARHERGEWRSLRTHRPRQALGNELGAWIDQARLIDGIDGPDQVVVAGTERHDLGSLARPGWTWTQSRVLEMP